MSRPLAMSSRWTSITVKDRVIFSLHLHIVPVIHPLPGSMAAIVSHGTSFHCLFISSIGSLFSVVSPPVTLTSYFHFPIMWQAHQSTAVIIRELMQYRYIFHFFLPIIFCLFTQAVKSRCLLCHAAVMLWYVLDLCIGFCIKFPVQSLNITAPRYHH